jgi:tRNA nucleotidyltransferase/poly(A) polymerase
MTMSSNVKVYGSFHFAESCTFDANRNLILAMNAGNAQNLAPNDGFVSLINPDGSVHTSKWIGVARDGLTLNHPLGSAIQGNTLYTVDIDTIRTFEKLALTRKLTATMREVWAMQPRFEQRGGQRPSRLLEAPRFRMGYDFLALRAASGEVSAELEAWWRAFQQADPDSRHAMLLPDTGPRKKRRRRRRRQDAGTTAPEQA